MMIAAYKDGRDLHADRCPYSRQARRRSKADRQLAKAVNFGLLYDGLEGAEDV